MTANKVQTTEWSSYANVIKKPLVVSKSFQFRSGIPFYRSVVIRTEIITTATYTIMRRLDPPTANYETPNSVEVNSGRSDTEDPGARTEFTLAL